MGDPVQLLSKTVHPEVAGPKLQQNPLDYPEPDANWRIVVEELGATGIFTSPTAVRALMKYGDGPLASIDHSGVERVFSAGEVLNAPAWDWLQNTILGGRIPVIDHMWQTETSGPVFGNPYGLGMLPIKPGSAAIPLPGIDAAVVHSDGTPCAVGEKGIMVLKRPFPGLTASLWGEPERYRRDYWDKISGLYYSGDAAHVDEDGYVWFSGRADEIIKIAAHRIGTIEVETACLKHPAVAECHARGGDLSLRAAQERSESFGRAPTGRDRYDPSPTRTNCRHRRAQFCFDATQDPERKDHASGPQGGGPRPRPRRHHHDRRRRVGRRSATGLARDEGRHGARLVIGSDAGAARGRIVVRLG